MVAYVYNPVFCRQRQEDCHKLQENQVYIVILGQPMTARSFLREKKKAWGGEGTRRQHTQLLLGVSCQL